MKFLKDTGAVFNLVLLMLIGGAVVATLLRNNSAAESMGLTAFCLFVFCRTGC